MAGAFAPSEDELSSADYFGLIAADWAAGPDAAPTGGHRRRARLSAALATIGTGPGVLLEIGFGSGHLIPPLLRAGWDVHGVDPAPAMVEQAREHAPAAASRLIAGRAARRRCLTRPSPLAAAPI